jgi:subtilisin family serine protease
VQGTSFAAPLVAGVAALVRSRWPTLDAANVINRLIRTARDLGPTGRDDRYGYGEINPVAAVSATVPVVRRNPLVAPKAPVVERLSERTPPPERASGADRARPIPYGLLIGVGIAVVVLVLVLVAGLLVVLRFTRSPG